MQKKRRKLRLISLLCGAAMLAGLINPAMFGGGASEVEAADAIEISTPEELQKIGKDAAYPLSGDYVLKNDLDMAGRGFYLLGGGGGGGGRGGGGEGGFGGIWGEGGFGC